MWRRWTLTAALAFGALVVGLLSPEAKQSVVEATPPGILPAGVTFDDATVYYAVKSLAEEGDPGAAIEVLERLESEKASKLANRLFSEVHPQADRGDDLGTKDFMAVVVTINPDNYQAVYHLGMGQALAGEHDEARRTLNRFLDMYDNDDQWRRNALRKLSELE